jgi:hypothetical protein
MLELGGSNMRMLAPELAARVAGLRTLDDLAQIEHEYTAAAALVLQ